MRIAYDSNQRQRTLEKRGLDFKDARSIFEGITLEIEDLHKDYGERRIICYGSFQGPIGGSRIHPTWPSSPHLQHAKGQRS